MKDVKILSIDFSLSGSAFIYGNINSDRINYVYFSGLKKDIKELKQNRAKHQKWHSC